MKNYVRLCLALCLLAASLAAQTNTTPPPKVLVVGRELVKPGKSGTPHQKTESAFVQAMTAANWPTHYLGMDSLSGISRSLFFTGYDSFAAWEKDTLATIANATLSAALDKAYIADGDLLTSNEQGVYVYREDYSFNADVNIAQMRYFEISVFKVRPGHVKDWETIVKMYTGNFGKADPNAHWATYEERYGRESGDVYVVLTPMKSLAEVDNSFASSKKFAAQLGEDGMKQISTLAAACIESSESNLFMLNPKMSYVSDAWKAADPFWKPKQ